MISLRSLAPITFASLILAATNGCKNDPPPPSPEPLASGRSDAPLDKNKLSTRDPRGASRIDPRTLKEYRLDVCYYGTLSFRQARDAYLSSVGPEGPSAKKIPNFGIPATPSGASSAAAKPSAAPAAPKAPTPAAAPKTSAAPAGSAKPAVPPGVKDRDARKPFDALRAAPYERNARACAVAQGLKEPAMPDIDAAVTAFSPFALELSKNIAEAAAYYQREAYKEDKFEKGKELHKKLGEGFGKLDELSDKLGAAIAAWHKEHPPDAAKMEEGQKLAFAAFDEGQKLLLSLLPKKVDAGAYKEGIARLEKAVEALKAFGTANSADLWAKGMLPALESYVKTVKETEPKVTEAGLPGEMFGQLVTAYVALIENKQRSVSRSLYNKNQGEPARAPLPRPALSAAPKAPEDVQ